MTTPDHPNIATDPTLIERAAEARELANALDATLRDVNDSAARHRGTRAIEFVELYSAHKTTIREALLALSIPEAGEEAVRADEREQCAAVIVAETPRILESLSMNLPVCRQAADIALYWAVSAIRARTT